MNVYQAIKSFVKYRNQANNRGDHARIDLWSDLCKRAIDQLPTGGGFDSPRFMNNSDSFRIESEFHVMDNVGYYVGWLKFIIEVKESRYGLDVDVITINGAEFENDCDCDCEDVNDDGSCEGDCQSVDIDGLVDYIGDCYYDALTSEFVDA